MLKHYLDFHTVMHLWRIRHWVWLL